MKAARKAATHAVSALRTKRSPDVFEGHVTAVGETTIDALFEPGHVVEARCPAHVDRNWLVAAVAVAPVEAAFVMPQNGGRPILLAIFPGPEHVNVRADITMVGRRVRIEAEEVRVQGTNAHLALDKNGAVELRGKDVTTRATRLHRIQGGAIRLN